MKILKATVYHNREKPRKNSFLYKVFYVSFFLHEKKEKTLSLFSFDRFNILSVYRKDHGSREEEMCLYDWAKEQFAQEGIFVGPQDSISIVTHPRLFGYVFNPISFWLLHNEKKELFAVLCEVNNTFGQNHNYVLVKEDRSPITATDVFVANKSLYVSPFNPMEGYYEFRFDVSDSRFVSSINYFKNDEMVLETIMQGKFAPMTNRAILLAVAQYPFMTIMVIVRIHWQALKLFFKRVPSTLSMRPKSVKKPISKGIERKNI